jgi:DNA polymerase III alpha subunit (gram-positive type)
MNPLDTLYFLDTETTGLGSEDRLCQCAYIYQGQEYDELFKPPLPIEVGAQAISHITNKHVADKPVFAGSEMQAHLQNLGQNGSVLVAHNAPFDIAMLKRDGVETEVFIDTKKVAQALDPTGELERYAMQYLRYYFELEVENAVAHDALGEVRVLKALFMHQLSELNEQGMSEEEALAWMIEQSSLPQKVIKFTFGKYRGEKVSDVAQKDAGYIKWLFGEKQKQIASGEISEDDEWVYTLKDYCN